MSNGKGDTRRPENAAAIEANWDRIFAKPEAQRIGLDADRRCMKCRSESGDDWSQCRGVCPVAGSPHYTPGWRR